MLHILTIEYTQVQIFKNGPLFNESNRKIFKMNIWSKMTHLKWVSDKKMTLFRAWILFSGSKWWNYQWNFSKMSVLWSIFEQKVQNYYQYVNYCFYNCWSIYHNRFGWTDVEVGLDDNKLSMSVGLVVWGYQRGIMTLTHKKIIFAPVLVWGQFFG